MNEENSETTINNENVDKFRTDAGNVNRETAENPASTGEKQANSGWFKPGQSGNPSGRKVGSKNYKTVFDEALKKIAKAKGKEVDQVEIDLVYNSIVKALNGNDKHIFDVLDRRFGKATQQVDMTTKGDKIYNLTPQEIAELNIILGIKDNEQQS